MCIAGIFLVQGPFYNFNEIGHDGSQNLTLLMTYPGIPVLFCVEIVARISKGGGGGGVAF